MRASTPAVHPSLNLAVVAGRCSGPPEVRVLPSGATVANLSVATRAASGPAVSVPVALWDPPAWVEGLAEGDVVVALGRVRRRFWRPAAGGTASRVELEAEAVARASDRRRVASLVRRAGAALDGLAA